MHSSASASTTFRHTLLGCLALQRLIVMLAVAFFTFCSPPFSTLDSFGPKLVVAAAAVFVVLIGCAFLARRANVVAKWLFLVLFSLAEAVLWTEVDKLLDTNIKLLNCCFTVAWTLLVVLFDTIRSRKRIKIHDAAMINAGGPAIGTGVASKIVETRTALSFLRKYFAATSDFLAIHKDGPVAFTITVIAACVVYAVYMSTVLSAMEFGLSLVFQFVLVSWFTLDLRRLDRHLNVNEASEGVIYVYLDAVVMAVYAAMVLIAFTITATICVGLATSHGADELRECGICDEYISCFMCIWRCFASQCVWIDCELWYDCLYDRYSKRQWCCCDCCQLLLDDSKCLCFSQKHGDSDCCESYYNSARVRLDPTVRASDLQRPGLDQVMQRV